MTAPIVDRLPTDYQRWEDPKKTFGYQNPLRAQYAASLIPDHAGVLDIGAASQILKRFLKPGCRYTPHDIIDRGDGCLVGDLNLREFPDGVFDWVAFIGVLEYVNDIEWALNRAGASCNKILINYVVLELRPDVALRRQRGWHTHLSTGQFEDCISAAGPKAVELPLLGWYILTFDRGTVHA